jgi:uncharacterized protein YyaL (SSP411 family)
VGPHGNVESDPHDEFAGKSILFEAHTLEETAQRFSEPTEKVSQELATAAEKLLAARSKRVRPHLDDKVLTAWNGLMISAFAKGGAVLREPRYSAAAKRAVEFILSRMYDGKTGGLLRRYRQGDAAISGFLDDYALFTQALVDLYETEFDVRYLQTAVKLAETQGRLFEDHEHGGFFKHRGGRREPVDPHEGGLRRRGALGQLHRGVESSEAGPNDRPAGVPQLGGENTTGFCLAN